MHEWLFRKIKILHRLSHANGSLSKSQTQLHWKGGGALGLVDRVSVQVPQPGKPGRLLNKHLPPKFKVGITPEEEASSQFFLPVCP